MASFLHKRFSLFQAKRLCKNISCEKKPLEKISTSYISLTTQNQISSCKNASSNTLGRPSSWLPQQKYHLFIDETPLPFHIVISANLGHLKEAYYKNHKRHWRSTKRFSQSLAFLCTGIALLLLSHDDEHSLWLTVAECTSSIQSDSVVKATSNKKRECGSNPSKEKSVTMHPSAEKTSLSLEEAIKISQDICRRKKEELGSPGLVVCVSVDGRQVYAEGFGYADLENEVPIQPDSVMRVASISKSITSVIVAKLFEEGKLNLDENVQHYVPDFPQKYFMGEKVDITVSHLLNHTSGIRHYKRENDPAHAFDKQIAELVKKTREANLLPFYAAGTVEKKSRHTSESQPFDAPQDIKEKEIHNNQNFPTVAKSLALFKDDPLMSRPGTKMVYTTHGYTLLSAVVEAVTKETFPQVVTKTFRSLGMKDSCLDKPSPIIYKRAGNYQKDKTGKLVNCPHVDNSYKWAGGGLLSTPENITRFGNILLYSAQHCDGDPGPPGYLKASTVWKFWSPPIGGQSVTPRYGLGFELHPETQWYGMCGDHTFGAGHTGNAVGASSALLILPRYAAQSETNTSSDSLSSSQIKDRATLLRTKNGLPQGVVVTVIVNLTSIALSGTAEKVARAFEKVDFSL